MQKVFGIKDDTLEEQTHIGPNTLVTLTNPSIDELACVAKACHEVSEDDIASALDDEETSRVEVNDRYMLLVLDIPVREKHGHVEGYQTYPVSIIITEDNVIIVISLVDIQASRHSLQEAKKILSSAGRPQYVYEMLMSMALTYQEYLREIESKRRNLVEALDRKTTNEDLLLLHGLETDVVYFETSLSANRAVLERASKSNRFIIDDDDYELLDDILVEIDQAAEMAHIYQRLVLSTRDLFKSVMDNSLNTTMKILTSITLILAVPTVISGFYGMNVASEGMPLSESPFGFGIIFIVTMLICIIVGIVLHKRNML